VTAYLSDEGIVTVDRETLQNAIVEIVERLLVVSKLSDYRSAGRYKLADTVTKNVLRIPSVKAVARHTRPKE
jgi:hypothetical protein